MGPTCRNMALSLAIVMLHTTCSTLPPPTAKPLTEAMTGFCRLLMASFISSVGHDDQAGARLAPDAVDAITDFVAHPGCEHVAVMRPVQRDRADGAVFRIRDFLELHGMLLSNDALRAQPFDLRRS